MARQGQGTPRKPRNIWIQDRDLAILQSIGVARLLTTQAIEWLHFNTWRERFKKTSDTAEKERKKPIYHPQRRVYTRLAGLEHHGLIVRLSRTTSQGILMFRALPDAFGLTSAGADLLQTHCGVEQSELSTLPRRRYALQNMEHTVAIGQFYAAVRSERERIERTIDDWMGDHRLHLNYDRVDASGGDHEQTSVIPDATFTLDGQRYFVEIDRGTTALKTWTRKTFAYEAYRGSPQLQARYGVDTFKVLIVAPDAHRINRIATHIAVATQHATPAYLFLEESKVHPRIVRKSWRVFTHVRPRQQRVVNTTFQTADIELGACVLWENETDE
jgi:hypothetical protein